MPTPYRSKLLAQQKNYGQLYTEHYSLQKILSIVILFISLHKINKQNNTYYYEK